MTWISASDPLALVYIQSGQIPTPNTQENAEVTNTELDRAQAATKIGEPVPIVFARRRDNAGGVLISPGATESRFANTPYSAGGQITSQTITVNYHLVLSEGQLGPIPVKDLFHGPCRIGSHTQTYNRRAGLWDPGNYIQYYPSIPFIEAPYYCGIVGTYSGMTTLSFEATYPGTSDSWKKQVHLFIRDGMYVTRLEDNVYGPSDSFADLVKWVYQKSARIPDSLLDNTALTFADLFLRNVGLRCNANIKESQNISDFLSKWAPYFLLKETRNNGRRGLRPLLPVTSGGAINTAPVTWKYTFTENDIVNGTFELQYSSLSDRQPFVVQVIWRQQLEDDFGITRTAEIRYGNTALTGPYEQHDLSAFCTTELHAVKVGAYILSKRVRTTHTVRFTAKPQIYNKTVAPGDIIHIKLSRKSSTLGITEHDFLYQVERVTRTLQGDISYEAVHFPTDEQARSLVALDVVAATPTGALLPSNKTGLGCDINSYTNNTVPPESGRNDAQQQAQPEPLTLRGEAAPFLLPYAPDDGLDNVSGALGLHTEDGITFLTSPLCSGGSLPLKIEWWVQSGGKSTYTKVLRFTSRYMVINPMGLGRVIGKPGVTRAGDTYRAVWYCPKTPGTTKPQQSDRIVSEPYTVSSSDLSLAKWGPINVAFRIVVWVQVSPAPYAYNYDPNYPPTYRRVDWICYHAVIEGPMNPPSPVVGTISTYQSVPANYSDLMENALIQNPVDFLGPPNWTAAQGPAVIGYTMIGMFYGPRSSIGTGSMLTPPEGWVYKPFLDEGEEPVYDDILGLL
jgi:hypothetical protein